MMASARVAAGDYPGADRTLLDFANQYPGTPEATAAIIRRALFKADPANRTATAHGATALLDSLLTMPLDSAARVEADGLRRVTMALERAAVIASSSGGASASGSESAARADDTKANSDEVQRLRNELAKANAELERIKKRVAQPKP